MKSGAFCPTLGAPAEAGTLRTSTNMVTVNMRMTTARSVEIEPEILPRYKSGCLKARSRPIVSRMTATMANARLSHGKTCCPGSRVKYSPWLNTAAMVSRRPIQISLLRRIFWGDMEVKCSKTSGDIQSYLVQSEFFAADDADSTVAQQRGGATTKDFHRRGRRGRRGSKSKFMCV